jgi:hypothetical protein
VLASFLLSAGCAGLQRDRTKEGAAAPPLLESGIAVDSGGNLFLVDYYTQRIRAPRYPPPPAGGGVEMNLAPGMAKRGCSLQPVHAIQVFAGGVPNSRGKTLCVRGDIG